MSPRKNKGLISAFLGEDSLKLALWQPGKPVPQVINLWAQGIKDLSDEDLTAKVKEGLAALGVERLEAVCVLPPNATTTKNIEIPSLDPQEIRSIIDLQAGRHTPYSREEIVIGYINFGVYQKNYSKVLLVIVNRKIVMRAITALQGAGLSVERVLFAPEAKARFYASAVTPPTDGAPVGIVDVNADSTDFTIMMNGTVIACRSIPVGMAQLATGEAGKEKFINEFKQSIESYQSEDIEKLPAQYLLTDDRPPVAEIGRHLGESLKISVVPSLYRSQIALSGFATKVLEERADEAFFDVIAPVISRETCRIDFLPEEIKIQRSIQQQGKEGIKFGILSVIFVLLIGAIFMGKVYFKSTLLEKIKKEYAATQKDAERLESIATRTRIVKAYLNSRLVPLEVIQALYEIIPEEVYLRALSMDENGRILIEGTSDSMSQVFALVSSLEDSPMFKSVKTRSTTAKKERGKDVAAFEITFRLESADDEEDEIVEEEQPKGEAAKAPQANAAPAETEEE